MANGVMAPPNRNVLLKLLEEATAHVKEGDDENAAQIVTVLADWAEDVFGTTDEEAWVWSLEQYADLLVADIRRQEGIKLISAVLEELVWEGALQPELHWSGWEVREPGDETTLIPSAYAKTSHEARTYVDGPVEDVEYLDGFFCRMQMPGHLDATDWYYFDDAALVIEWLFRQQEEDHG